MNSRINFLEINYYCHREISDPGKVIAKHLPTNLYLSAMKGVARVVLVKHMNYEGERVVEKMSYLFFKRRNNFWQVPFLTHRAIKKCNPGLVLVQGIIFPLQVIFLRWKLGRNVIVILQHQGEVPYKRKRFFQRWADKSVNGYLFTSLANAQEWIQAGIIKNHQRCFEIPPATTLFSRQDKQAAIHKTGMLGQLNFLWVGRLNANKDPLTVLSAFSVYFSENPTAMLYMVYQEDDMLDVVRQTINQDEHLKSRAILVGKVEHEKLEDWYSAADYIVSASHREGGSYAIMEAMACGCVPIVTAIPAAMKMINYGKAGFYFEAGSATGLYQQLSSLKMEEYGHWSIQAEAHFKQEMSAPAIANKMQHIITSLQAK